MEHLHARCARRQISSTLSRQSPACVTGSVNDSLDTTFVNNQSSTCVAARFPVVGRTVRGTAKATSAAVTPTHLPGETDGTAPLCGD